MEKDLEKSCNLLEEMESMKQKNEKLQEVNERRKTKGDEITSDNVRLNS